MKTYNFGILAEKIAALFLIIKGYQILERRYKSHFGEIDIIAKKSRVIIAVEVKARKSAIINEEVLSQRQIERIKKSVEFFHAKNPRFHDCDLRIDFIEVGRFFIPKHYPNFIS